MQHHDEDTKPMSFKESVSAFIAIMQTVGRILELPFRWPGTAGEKHWSGHAALSLVIMFVAITLIDGQATTPLQSQVPWWQSPAVVAGIVAIGLLIVHKSREKKLKDGGYEVHSGYSGRSILDWGGTPESEMRAKGNMEPALAFILGAACLTFSYGLGVWMMIAAVGMGISVSVARMGLEARRRAVKDAMLDQQHVMNGIRREE